MGIDEQGGGRAGTGGADSASSRILAADDPFGVSKALRRLLKGEGCQIETVEEGPAVRVRADRDQLEQLLIKVISNAVEASQQSHPAGDGRVCVGWRVEAGTLEVRVDDDGPGLAEDTNVFVPFYTTKQQGSGIGLALSRQIAEAHHGSLTLGNHPEEPGCRATLRLPLGG